MIKLDLRTSAIKNNVTKHKNVFYVTCIGINFLIKFNCIKTGLERNPQQTKHKYNENQQKVKLKHIYEGRETTFVE